MSKQNNSENGNWIRAAVTLYESPLVRYATQITGNLETARDVVQDTFLRLCDQDQEKLSDRIAPWLFTVCRRRAIDVRRKENRMTTISEQQSSEQPSREGSQADVAEQRETTEQIEQLVDELPENQRDVVRLKFQGGLSYREISEVTDLSVTNVGYLLHTAIGKIRQQMKIQARSASE